MTVRALLVVALAAGLLAHSLADAAEQKASVIAKRGGPIAAGDVAPDFTLVDQEGRKHSLSAERGRRPVVLVFYRGHW